MFHNRQHAGRLLGGVVEDYLAARRSSDPEGCPLDVVVVALPRGGVPVACEVARTLDCPMDILVSKKIGAPGNPELAMGAVSSGGQVVFDGPGENIWSGGRAGDASQGERERLIAAARGQEEVWAERAGLSHPLTLAGRIVVVVDDGVATGMTTCAALRTVQERGARSTILATPVIPVDTYQRLGRECDRVLAILMPYEFSAVGFYYQDFSQVSDEEMIASLKAFNYMHR